MIKCCIFDLDGTVLDTLTTITYYVNYTLKKFGIKTISEEECKYFVGEGARALIERALRSRGILSREMMEEVYGVYCEAYIKNPMYLTKPFDGIEDVLLSLKKSGVKLALLSNKQNDATRGVALHFFPGIFDIVLGGVDGVPLKPHPDSAQNIMESLGVESREVAWIGDTSTDMQTAKNISAALAVGVTWGFRNAEELWAGGADTVVSEVCEIYSEVMKVG